MVKIIEEEEQNVVQMFRDVEEEKNWQTICSKTVL